MPSTHPVVLLHDRMVADRYRSSFVIGRPLLTESIVDRNELWHRYQQTICECPKVGLALDISRMDFDDGFFDRMEPAIQRAYGAMAGLEAGEIANPDERRMVGHYWLRAPQTAPSGKIRHQIASTIEAVEAFASDVHARRITPSGARMFTDLLVIGIGGSALGPQFVSDALGSHRDKLSVHFLDNTDPDGFDRMVYRLGTRIKSTLVAVISKSGNTKETCNGMLEIEHAFRHKSVSFSDHAVAVTREDSTLDRHARKHTWLRSFPMWDWVGGRTSVLSAVGLLPVGLQGIDIRALLKGAAEMDQITRVADTKRNPAARLALMWHHATDGHGTRQMVILPYKDRLILMSRYLQQLVMESLGKELDLDGNLVNQGIVVYGNKGSTDQHAYVQQLREGRNDFFVTFIVVSQDRSPAAARTACEVGQGTTSGDYLNGFWQGTREALYENGRPSLTIKVDRLDATSVGALIALYERAVGLYATLINVNAYHQPGVEAGKEAAQTVLELQTRAVAYLRQIGTAATPDQIAAALTCPDRAETIHNILEHLAANRRRVKKQRAGFVAV